MILGFQMVEGTGNSYTPANRKGFLVGAKFLYFQQGAPLLNCARGGARLALLQLKYLVLGRSLP